jgi:hypothetical protein
MHLMPAVLLVPLLAVSAHAQTGAAPSQAEHRRLAWEKHFAQANTTHDGHLTLEQAKAAYVTVARHFREMDSGEKGYVTEDDLRAWHKQQHSSRSARQASDVDPLLPRQAMHRVLRGQRQYNSTAVPVAPSVDTPPPQAADPTPTPATAVPAETR